MDISDVRAGGTDEAASDESPSVSQEQGSPSSAQLMRTSDSIRGAISRLPHRFSTEPSDFSNERYDAVVLRSDEGINDPDLLTIISVDHHQFNVPVKTLCQVSCFFRLKLRNTARGDPMPVLSLNGQHLRSVKLFIDWVQADCTFACGNVVNINAFNYKLLFQAFILGDSIQALGFQNDIMDIITAKLSVGHAFHPCLPHLAYQTPKGSALRRVLVDAYVHDGDAILVLDTEAQRYLHMDFMVDLSAALFCVRDPTYVNGPRPFDQSVRYCGRYHNHDLEGGGQCEGRRFDIIDIARPPTAPETDQDESVLSNPTSPAHSDADGPQTTPENRPSGPAWTSDSTLATPTSTDRTAARDRTTGANTLPRYTGVNLPSALSGVASASRVAIKPDPETPCPKKRKYGNRGLTPQKPIELD
ncbi:hypothetical protein ANO11243_078480 [Dothideomycetidae sp. 11243]|nr:hypothetical protein ANO11243_078480 [fungal sp. No.11243]